MKRFSGLITWLAGVAAASALIAALSLFFDLRYENSDDILLVKAFMGFEGGHIADFTLYTHTLLCFILSRLSAAVPGVAWFSLFQLGLLWFSSAVIVKCMAQIAASRSVNMLWGALAGVVYLVVFAAFAICRVTYTTTAALAGAAAVTQLFSLDFDKTRGGRLACGFALALLLLAGCYSLRQISVLPPLLFSLLALFYAAWRTFGFGRRGSLKPILLCLCALAFTFGGLCAMREIEINARGQRGFLDWHTARIELFDYTGFESDPAPAKAADSGLSDANIELVRQWYLMDEALTADALGTMSAAYQNEARQGALYKLAEFARGNTRYLFAFALVALLAVLCVTGSRRGGAARAVCAVLGVIGLLALLVYLSWRGRVLFRAVDSALFPCAAALFPLALIGLIEFFAKKDAADAERSPRLRRALAAGLCACCLLVAAGDALLTKRVLTEKPDAISQQREAELEAYALSSADRLILRTPNLLRDTRIFPDVSGGTPKNIAIWGDWYCRTPSWNAQLADFGFDAAHFTATDWLSERILFATADEAPPEALLTYLSEGAGAPVAARLEDEHGTLRFFSFAADR